MLDSLVHGPTVERLIGEFWTDLGTLGTIELLDRRSVKVDSYEAATAYFQTP